MGKRYDWNVFPMSPHSVLQLGFQLNSTSSGVYFKASTNCVYSITRDSFLYVERKKISTREVQETMSMYTLTNYLEDNLKKKVTLLQHFYSYLLDQ